MWVLSTDRAQLHFFADPEDIEDGYAALSHVWDRQEQSFQDVLRIQERCAHDGTNSRQFMCEKIRRCCELAESHGYKWIWVDTCCIDKTSSAELSEAINSMYRYYALSRICYGYLRDVTFSYTGGRRFTGAERRAFLRSIWFKRGWTLQELIAPRFFLFVSESWQVLGTKADLAGVLGLYIGIPSTVLRLEVSHTAFSIAQRMSWFGERKTTRVEDEAYCLLGLFDIHMPPLYGEGRNAFRRLQEEIMRQSGDTTLFAWDGVGVEDHRSSCLFAPSPSAFVMQDITYKAEQTRQIYQDLPRPSGQGPLISDMAFSITPYGILAGVPIVSCRGLIFADLRWSLGDGRRALLCLEEDSSNSHTCPSLRCRLYYVRYPRILGVLPPAQSGEYTIDGLLTHTAWREVLIRHRLPLQRLPGQLSDTRTTFVPPVPAQLTLNAPFRFYEDSIRTFMQQSWSDCVRVCNSEFHYPHAVDSNRLPTTYVFIRDSKSDKPISTVIRVGQCGLQETRGVQLGPDAGLWARANRFVTLPTSESDVVAVDDSVHDCPEDHVSRWPNFKMDFALGRGSILEPATVTLSFAPCPINEGSFVLEATMVHSRWS